MRASVAVAQLPVSWDIEQNLATIAAVLSDVRPDEIVVLPEGAMSGYGDDLSALDTLDQDALAEARERLADLAERMAIHLFCGSLHFEHGAWWNTAQYLSPYGDGWTYRKVNLATHERGLLAAGSELAALPLRLADGRLTVGVQICREIHFPEQWQHLAASGAQVFVYLTHAVNRAEPPGVWRSHLVSRAAENQRSSWPRTSPAGSSTARARSSPREERLSPRPTATRWGCSEPPSTWTRPPTGISANDAATSSSRADQRWAQAWGAHRMIRNPATAVSRPTTPPLIATTIAITANGISALPAAPSASRKAVRDWAR